MESLLHLVGEIYEAALDEAGWPRCLEKLSEAVRAANTVIVTHDLSGRPPVVHWAARWDEGYRALYENRYGALNPWIRRKALELDIGEVSSAESAVPLHELQRTEFYEGFLRPQKLLHAFGACLGRSGTRIWLLSGLRSRHAGAFETQELERVRRILPHLQRALRVRQRLAGLEVQSRGLRAALDRVPSACLLVDRSARIQAMNRAAAALLEAREGVAPASGKLAAAFRHDARELAGVLRDGGAMKLSRASLRRPLHLLSLPFASGAVVFIADPSREAGPPEHLLRQLFGVTAGESRVAAALMNGKSLEQIAEELAISIHTARNHLKSIFAKTETRRQGELVRLLWAGAGHVDLHGQQP